MEKDGIESIKKGKPFRKLDLIVYAVIAVIVGALFLSVLLPAKNSSPDGFKVYIQDKTVLTYYFQNNALSIENDMADLVSVGEDQTIITVYLNAEKTKYNILKIDTENKSVKMAEANCSIKKDCVYSPALSSSSGAIICMPHQLKIVSINSGFVPPTVG